MKNIFLILAILLSLSFTVKGSDCENIELIMGDSAFESCFGACARKGDQFTIYIKQSKELKGLSLCEPFRHSCGKQILFAQADFEVKIDQTSRKVVNPRIVVWKEKNKYHFFETETNLKLSASVKNGKVVDINLGVF